MQSLDEFRAERLNNSFDYRITAHDRPGRSVFEVTSVEGLNWANDNFGDCDRKDVYGFITDTSLLPMIRAAAERDGLIDEETYSQYMQYEQLRQGEMHQYDCDMGGL